MRGRAREPQKMGLRAHRVMRFEYHDREKAVHGSSKGAALRVDLCFGRKNLIFAIFWSEIKALGPLRASHGTCRGCLRRT